MFCRNCEQQINEGASFCTNCGSQIEGQPKFCEHFGTQLITAAAEPGSSQTTEQQPAPEFDPARFYAGNGSVRNGIPAPGYSDRCNDPEILQVLQKNRKAGNILSVFLILLPLAGFVIYSIVTDKMPIQQACKNGLIISGVFLFFAIAIRNTGLPCRQMTESGKRSLKQTAAEPLHRTI